MGSFVLLQNNFARKRSVTRCPYHEKTAPLDCAYQKSNPRSQESGSAECLKKIIAIQNDFLSCSKKIIFDILFSGIPINSTIIADNEFYLTKLKEFLPEGLGNRPFFLCYRASSHGWFNSEFHSKCDGKNHTVSIIKKGPYVFGGYTDIPWGNNFCIPYLTPGIIAFLDKPCIPWPVKVWGR